MAQSPEHLPIELSLEDSGTLYHLLMQKLLTDGIDPARPIPPQVECFDHGAGSFVSGKTLIAIYERHVDLLVRLSELNDKLMGKVS